MTPAPRIAMPLPPHLSMDEYCEFVEAAIRECDPALAARQKDLEGRIKKPFRMTPTRLSSPPAVDRPMGVR